MEEKDREAFQRVKEKSEDDFEKYITYISAGALGLSLTFIEKIVQFKETVFLWVLILGWLFLTLTLLVNLLSHFYSKRLIDKTIEDFDNKDPSLLSNIKKRNKNIDKVNISTIITLILGITLLIIFISLNANNMAKERQTVQKPQQNERYEELGRTIPQPRDTKPPVTPNKRKS